MQSTEGWTSADYRRALEEWRATAPKRDSFIAPRKAKSASPRHAELAERLKSLLKWRDLQTARDWTAIAANDNAPDDNGDVVPMAMDSKITTNPTEAKIFVAIKGVEFEERRHAKLGGGGQVDLVPVGGELKRNAIDPVARLDPKRPGKCIVQLGDLEFSNGGRQSRALVRNATGRVVWGRVRIPLGGMVHKSGQIDGEVYKGPKGAANDNEPITVGASQTANHGAFHFEDPFAEANEALAIREAVGSAAAEVLDATIFAANFADVGCLLGYEGKAAERKGKAAVLEACAVLDRVLAA